MKKDDAETETKGDETKLSVIFSMSITLINNINAFIIHNIHSIK